jgi:glycosyltransferase involved in cell wall biosynthesis
LNNAFRNRRFSIVAVQFVSLDGLVALFAKKLFKSKIVLFAIGSDVLRIHENPLVYPLIKLVLTESDLIFCASVEIEKKLQNMGVASKLKVVPSVVNFDDFEPYDGSKIYDVVSVGFLDSNKNQIMLIKACELLPKIKVLIIGDGPLLEVLQSESLKGNVATRFLGAIPHKQVLKELQKSRIYVQTSRSEGLPVAILEAIFLGLPVIISGGSYSFDLENRYGFSFHTIKKGGIIELANVISQVLRTYESESNKAALNKQKMLNFLNESSNEIKATLDRLRCSTI